MNLAPLARYAGLALHVRRGMGERPGERRFPGRPQPAGSELEAYAAYAPGDDLRHLDWNALGRLDALLVRRFTAEREVLFHLLLDASASMGTPPQKLAVACELALALAHIALGGGDAVRIALPGDGDALRASPVYRHRARTVEAARLLDGVAARGSFGLGAALTAYARAHPRPGAALVVSDFMMAPEEVERGVLALRARRYDVALLHVIAPEELEPAFARGVLVDVESSATRPMVLTRAALARYQAVLHDHLGALAAIAERTRTLYARVVTGASLEAFVRGELGRLGLVRRR